ATPATPASVTLLGTASADNGGALGRVALGPEGPIVTGKFVQGTDVYGALLWTGSSGSSDPYAQADAGAYSNGRGFAAGRVGRPERRRLRRRVRRVPRAGSACLVVRRNR